MNQLNVFEESWIDIEGKYQVNGRGEVKSLNYNQTGKEKLLKPFYTKDGYLQVDLCLQKRKSVRVHRLVWEAFYGKIPDGMEIDHIDTNRENNRLSNLRCVTSMENSQNPITKKRQADSAKRTFRKSVNQFTLEGEFVKAWTSTREIERELGYNHASISLCCNGKLKQAYGYVWKYAS